MRKIKYFIDYFKYLKNPINCLLFKFGLKKEVKIKFKNSNKVINMNNVELLNKLMGLLSDGDYHPLDELLDFFDSLTSTEKVITWGGVNILNFMIEKELDSIPFYEYFMPSYYTSANISYKDRCVIDIGSFAGDTALIFAKQGAEVYGFEPVKKYYEYSLKHKELNPKLKDKLHFFNLAVSDKPGKITIESMNSTSDYRNPEDAYEVEIVTLNDILNKNNIEPDILKIDCEGCEYDIILNLDLSDFKDIIFEHHAGCVKREYTLLTDKLKNEGFKIKKIEFTCIEFEKLGLIHAYK
jgi:FkbM family methyltransferase